MVTPDIEDAVAAQEIEIGVVIHVVEISASCPGIDFIETDNTLRGDEGAVEMPLVQLVVFAQPGGDDFLQVKSHRHLVGDLAVEGKRRASRKKTFNVQRDTRPSAWSVLP